MAAETYNMAYTAGGLYLQESADIAKLYLEEGNWRSVRNKALQQNVLQARTVSSASRICREICSRLEGLSDECLNFLASGTLPEQQQILWFAICRRHRFIYEFAVEVLREKLFRLDLELRQEDYDAFFNAKAQWHDELEKLTPSTCSKIRQVLFRILRESGLLSQNNSIVQVSISPIIVQAIKAQSSEYLYIFPTTEKNIRELLQ